MGNWIAGLETMFSKLLFGAFVSVTYIFSLYILYTIIGISMFAGLSVNLITMIISK